MKAGTLLTAIAIVVLLISPHFAHAAYTLTKTVTPENSGEVYSRGILIDGGSFVRYRVEAMPAVGWKFIGWSGDLSGTENPVELDLYMDKSITAHFAPSSFTAPLQWNITRITGDNTSGIKPSTSGSHLAWQFTSSMSSTPFNLYLWDGSITRMSPLDSDAHNPSLDGDALAYEGYDGADYEIYYRVGLDPRVNVTDDDLLDTNPSLHAGRIAFETLNGVEWDIRCWTGTGILTVFRSGQDHCPSIHNNLIAWQGFDGNDYEIFVWNGDDITRITDNDTDDTNPSLYNGEIAWENGGDILFYDGSSIRTITTDNNYYTSPSLHEGAIAFKGIVGNKGEIFFWDGLTVQNVPNSNYDEQEPSLSSDNGKWTLSWRANDTATSNYIWFATLEEPAIRSITTLAGGSTEIKWLSLEGNSYTVLYSDDDYGAAMTWHTAATDVSGSSPLTSWIDDGSLTGGLPASHRYYKVEFQTY